EDADRHRGRAEAGRDVVQTVPEPGAGHGRRGHGLAERAEGCSVSGVTATVMNGNSGRFHRISCSSSELSTSKMLTLLYWPTPRHRGTQVPVRCSSSARAFSFANSVVRSSGSRSRGTATSMRTWNSMIKVL